MKLTRLASIITLSCLSSAAWSAAYTVQELPTQSLSTNSYGLSIDNSGLVLTTLEDIFNAPINVSLLPLETDTFIANLTDLEAVRNGQFNDSDYTFLIAALRGSADLESQLSQPMANFVSYSSDGSSSNYVEAFDEVSEELSSFSFSMDTLAVDSVGGDFIVANTEGPFSELSYINTDGDEIIYILPEFDQRAIVQTPFGVANLVPQNTVAGGVSRASGINENLQVVGSMSVNTTTAFDTAVENCNDDDTRGDIPVEACVRSLLFNITTTGATRSTGAWINRATVWDLNAQGEVVNSTVYGLTFDLTDEQAASVSYFSQASGLNNQGKAVGTSTVLFNDVTVTSGATLYENGVSTRILEEDSLLPNSAVSINDNDLVIGSRQQLINSVSREKMFVHNLSTDDTRFVQGFFESSATTPRAINSSNIIVGNGEIEATTTSTRRRAGFIYDFDNDTFTDINTLIECESEYSIVEAVDINDNGEIAATALVKRPLRDFRGEEVLNDAGETVEVDTIVTLKLTPTGQGESDCSAQDDETDPALERQGASLSPFAMLSLMLLTFVRVFRKR